MTTFESRLGKRRIVLACLALAGLAGVARPVAAQSGAVEAIGPRLGKEYRLLQMVVAGQELPIPEESPITLKLLSDTVLGGKATVNLYFTGFDLDDQGHIYWRKPGFATTLMAGPPELMQLEQAFFSAMSSTNALSFAGPDLVLADADSTTRLTFQEADFDAALQALYGKTLFLRRMIADGTEVALPPGAEITLSLTKDGRVAGLAAVNRYFGAWKQLANGGIEMSRAFATTKMAGPPELMQAEDTFLRALAGVERIEISAGVLTLENAAKSIVLDFGPPR